MITVKRPQGQKDESKREKERRAGLEGENSARKADGGKEAESMQPAGALGGSSPAPRPLPLTGGVW